MVSAARILISPQVDVSKWQFKRPQCHIRLHLYKDSRLALSGTRSFLESGYSNSPSDLKHYLRQFNLHANGSQLTLINVARWHGPLTAMRTCQIVMPTLDPSLW